MIPEAAKRAQRPHLLAATLCVCLGLGACGGPETMIASSIVSAAVKTAIEQAEKNRPSPEQLWHEAQLERLERLAAGGDTEAQFQLGTYYLMLGDPASQQWICAAANRGHARAQLQYGHWFNEDRAREDLFPFITITPNNADAYMWYDLATRNGESRAAHFRDNLIYAGMTSEKLDTGRTRADNWSPEPCPTGFITAAAGSRPVR